MFDHKKLNLNTFFFINVLSTVLPPKNDMKIIVYNNINFSFNYQVFIYVKLYQAPMRPTTGSEKHLMRRNRQETQCDFFLQI